MIGSNARHVTVRVRWQNMRVWSARHRVERSRMRGPRNGRGSTKSSRACENGDPLGRFLAKLVLLKEYIQQINDAVVARE
jgi:hypothetical protein